MFVKMHFLGLLFLIASTVALPFISDSPNEESVQNLKKDKSKSEKVVVLEENKEKENDKYNEKDVEKSVFQGSWNSFLEDYKKEKASKEDKKNKVDKYNNRFPKESKEKKENYIDKKKSKPKKDKVGEKINFQVFYDSIAKNSKVKDSKKKEDNDNRFPGDSKEKNEYYKDKEKDEEKSDFQVFLGLFGDNFNSKKEKKNKRDKYNNGFYPGDYVPVYYVIDVKFKEDKIKVYPDVLFDNFATERGPESFYDNLNFISSPPYYPPRSFVPFQVRPKNHRSNHHKKRKIY